MKRILAWVENNPRVSFKSTLDIVWVVFWCAFVTMLIFNTTAAFENSKVVRANSQKNQRILERLDKADRDRTKRVNLLVDNNNKQTLILCKLIINGSSSLSADEAKDVEAICNERIQQATLQAAAAPDSASQTSSNVRDTTLPQSSSSTQSTPATTPAQSNTPQQPAKPLDCKIDLLGQHFLCP